MAETYFSKFNQISYANNLVVDITERVVVANNVDKNPYLFYPLDITNGVRPDNIAYNLYSDPYTSWIIYLTNNIVDPYYEWYLSDKELNDFIVKKYGSFEKAMQKVMYYTTNSLNYDNISEAAFNALTDAQKTYWSPNIDAYNRITDYSRKVDNWKATTNKVVSIQLNNTSNVSFVPDEIVILNYTLISISPTPLILDFSRANIDFVFANGQAQVVSQPNSNTLILQHAFGDVTPPNNGNFIIDSSSYLYGKESNANVEIVNCSLLNDNLPDDIYAYWEPVYYYDHEVERNEGNKTIKMLKAEYSTQFITNTRTLLGNT